jgi:hypothetical protein
MSELKKRKGNTLYKINPFIESALVETKTRRITNKRGDMMIIGETGEIISPIAGFWESEQVDSTKFVKLYINGVKRFKELAGAGAKVFEVLYLEVQKSISKDRIYMSFGSLDQMITPMSEATYGRGMRELIDKNFLAASPHIGLYWLNPYYIWNGDRLAFFKEYMKVSSKNTQEIDIKIDERLLNEKTI